MRHLPVFTLVLPFLVMADCKAYQVIAIWTPNLAKLDKRRPYQRRNEVESHQPDESREAESWGE